jgi:hypothetical protein
MTKFHEGQEVEVAYTASKMGNPPTAGSRWRKAKIMYRQPRNSYLVELPDLTYAVFDAEHIRAVSADRIAGIAKRQAAYDGVPRIRD